MSELTAMPTSPHGGPAAGEQGQTWSGRALRGFAALLIVIGALTLIDAGITLLWQEPISALYATLRQDRLSGALSKVEHAKLTVAERHKLASIAGERRRISFLADQLKSHAGEGSPVGRIVIPHIGTSFVIVKGANTEDLENGPGVYPQTSFPGAPGTTAIAGHRTTYLAPFRHIDALRPGDRILLEMPYARLTYSVVAQRVVEPTDVQAAVGKAPYSRLVLSACTPLFSAAKRLLVYARLVGLVPEGSARWLPGGVVAQPIGTPAGPARRRVLPAVLESLDPHKVAPIV